jgi:glycine hydroxymethyltransferase
MNSLLKNRDPVIHNLISKEFDRQKKSLELIASENYVNSSIFECLGSVLTNKYSEGLPGKRYYGGCEVIDQIETLCIDRALQAYHLDPEQWGVNVQAYSGSIANICAYNAILKPHDRIMGLDLPSGGHLSHGYYTGKNKVSSTSIVYESLPYTIKEDGYIDYDNLEHLASVFKPKLIICGASAYPRDFDYKRFREIADINKSYLLCDMSHISGFIATKQLNNPFEYCDMVTTTTHKTLAGPRASLIFFKKELESQVNFSVFPSIQGGPHQNNICAVATQLLQAQTEEYTDYIKQVKMNAQTLAEELIKRGYTIATNGTDNHTVLVNLKPNGITGSKVEKICEEVDISINKNFVYGDKGTPNGIRLGACAFTTRGAQEKDFVIIADLLHKSVELGKKIQGDDKLLKVFISNIEKYREEIDALRKEVNDFTDNFEYYV